MSRRYHRIALWRSLFVVGLVAAVAIPRSLHAEPVVSEQPPTENRFYVGEFRVEGNTLLDPKFVELAVYPYLGENKTIADIESARQTLEQRYRDAGFPTVLVNIPPQDVIDGVVKLTVVEGRVDRFRITGSRYFSLEDIRKQVPALEEGQIPYLPAVQEQISQLNRETADRAVTPILRPGRTPGTLEVELKVKDEFPLHGGLELNNHYSVNTSKLRLAANLKYDNLWQKQHSFSLQYQNSPEETDEVKVFAGTYLARFEQSDNLLVVYGVKSDSETETLGELAVIGKGEILGVRGVLPLAPSADYFHSALLGFDYKDFDETVNVVGSDTLQTPIDYINWSVQYNGTIRHASSLTQFGIGPNFGIRGVGNDAQEFDDKRVKSKPNYIYLRGNIEHNRGLVLDTLLKAKFSAQVADSPLISNEQFSAGGADSVRGYYEAQALGDYGYVANFEWYTPSFAPKLSSYVNDFRLLVYADASQLWLREPLAGQTSEWELYGAGAGLRMTAFKTLNINVDWARALRALGEVEKNEDRSHFSVEWTF